MEDQIPFKVFTFWSADSKPEVRRFGVERSVVTNFQYLSAKLQNIYPGLHGKNFTISWKDEEGDDVTISSDDEIMIALGAMSGDLVKLYVHCKDVELKDDADGFNAVFMHVDGDGKVTDVLEHAGVVCDSCDAPVVGYRYKCATCLDYDLCSRCEAAGLHPEHCMVRVPKPYMPRALLRNAIKRSRLLLKTVAANAAAAGAAGEECPFKKNRRERSGERKRQHRGEEHGHRSERRRECRQRGSWLETFTTYMNEFANLAGDVDCHPPKPTQPQQAATQETQPNQAANQGTQSNQATNKEPQPSEQNAGENTPKGGGEPKIPQESSSKTQCPIDIQLDKFINPGNVKYMLDLQKTLTNILIPNLVDLASSASTQTPMNNDVEMGQGDRERKSTEVVQDDKGRQSVESDRASVKSEASSTSSEMKQADSSSEKVDDWTMIHKDNDLMYMGGASSSASAPVDPTPIGFNLPLEFHQHVRINEGQSLYPPLNISTAVLNPVAAELPSQSQPQATQSQPQATQPQPQATQPQPQASQPQPAQAAPQPQPQRQRHPKPHIEAAIQQMLSMGFNNDSGWLTQLLDNNNGNISAVLDLLTPVTPKRK